MSEVKKEEQKPGMAEQGSSSRTSLEKKSIWPLEARQATWEDYMDAAFLCGETISVAEAQLELKLTSSVRDNFFKVW